MSSERPSNDNGGAGDLPPPIRSIVVGTGSSAPQKQSCTVAAVVDTTLHRAVHKIRLSALVHNFSEVESAANRQKCSVIVVVKADGYGHGAIPSALYLADTTGADAFAVATLEVCVYECVGVVTSPIPLDVCLRISHFLFSLSFPRILILIETQRKESHFAKHCKKPIRQRREAAKNSTIILM